MADVLLRRLAVVPTFVSLAVVVTDLVFIAGFDWCSGGHSGGGSEEEDFGELHDCLWSERLELVYGCYSLGLMRWRCELMVAKRRKNDSIIYPKASAWVYTTSHTWS